MKTLNLQQMEVIEGGRMFGYGPLYPTTEADPNCPTGFANVIYEDFFVLWVVTSHNERARECVGEV